MTKALIKPIFAQALGDNWQHVAPSVRAHYDLLPMSEEKLVLDGVMSVYFPRPAILLLGFARLLGGLVLLREENIPVRVTNSSRPESEAVFWHRSFHVPGKQKDVLFCSRMEYAGGDEIVEYVGGNGGINMGIRMKVSERNGDLHYESSGYLLKLGPFDIPIPGHLLLGKASISEQAMSENAISMSFTIEHSLWGRIYSYCGEFSHQGSKK